MKLPGMLATVLLCACASSVRATAGDASPDGVTTPDVVTAADGSSDAPSGAGAWRVGPTRDLVGEGATSCTLVDAVPGAWVLRACRFGAEPTGLMLTRHSADGATLTLHRFETATASTEGLRDAALAVDERAGRRVMVLPTASGRNLMGFDERGTLTWVTRLNDATGGFSLDAFRGPMVRATGYAVLADQVRALWGNSLALTDERGAITSAPDLGVISGGPPATSRAVLDDGGFALGWYVPRASSPSPLFARVYRDAVSPLGEAITLGQLASTSRYAIRGDAEGLVAVWETGVDTVPPLAGVSFRALTRDGRARGEATVLTSLGFYGGALDAALARGEVLVTAITGSGTLRLSVLAVSRDGAALGDPVAVSPVDPLGPDLSHARIVVTDEGALVAFQRTRDVVAVAALTRTR